MDRLSRRIGGFVRRAAPILKKVAKLTAPIIVAAVGVALIAELRQKSGKSVGEFDSRTR